MVLLQRELYFPKDREGGQHFPVGSNFFQGGGDPNANFYITCDFQRGSGPSIPHSGSAHGRYSRDNELIT